MAMPLATPEDIEIWNSARYIVEQTMEVRFPEFEVEHEMTHFFDDADIRARDSGYREYQHGLMSDYVRRLRSH